MKPTFRIEATRPWTGVSNQKDTGKKLQRLTMLIDLKEPDIKLSLKRYKRSVTLVVCRRMKTLLAWTIVMDWS